MKRLFVAFNINPDPDFLSAFCRLRHALSHEKINWVEEKNIHITLKFLGETEERLIPDISQVLKNLTKATSSFTFRLAGLGVFGSSYNPRVIWTGIEPYDELATLMKRASLDFESLGFQTGRQNQVPHLTLGRIKYLQDKVFFQKILDKMKGISSHPVSVKHLILYESILRPKGPDYYSIETFLLKK
ncbi:MAG: RNA 2',3'-cyclic phosphodiesterase [Bacteroidales bacterium]|nr:RNA 2',3'-cyclic phosphodiesterase [Bacteroidota bacterium]MBL6949036.1 RNA 2',3'-cyclic phosphodiesterase [Bacteroidales bacterium]